MNDAQAELDAAREARIAEYAQQMVQALNGTDRRRAYTRMCAEIHKRSPEQIERMEQQQGTR
ncbi:hypothetical protein [Pararobbsia silviterrae]|uniref:Uncharacterized protein n=1 Tax=Pararobbsia silviterrae TaxID=1792498 RepID=A0A494Y0U7_9BURK|nr:hypothetical protein [Pararobbsia silviterrae]RKP56382.1 hypothetical protein D7S86_08270 [Pararobbsia silviterrae]